jgi:hypothetical protein
LGWRVRKEDDPVVVVVVVVVAGGEGMLGSITAGIELGLGFDAPFLKNPPRQHNGSNPSSGFEF